MKKKLSLAAVALLAILVAFSLTRRGDAKSPVAEVPAERVDAARELAKRFVAAHEARIRLHAQAPPSQEERHRKIAENAPNVRHQLLAQGEGRWKETVLTLDDLSFEKDARRACASEYGKGIREACGFRIEMAIERTGASAGRVAFSQVEVDQDGDPMCQPYAECIARGRLGRQVPLPSGEAQQVYGVAQKLFAAPLEKDSLDPVKVRQDLAEIRIVHEENRRQLATTVEGPEARELEFVVAKTDRLLAFLEGWLRELEARK
jgi:hypothetical protein